MKKQIILIVLTALLFCMSVFAADDIDGFHILNPGNGIIGSDFKLENPEDPVTAGELVRLASRYHNVYNGNTAVVSDGWSFDTLCTKYALPNGLIIEQQFESENELVSRADVVYILGQILSPEDLSPINSALMLPDSDPSSLYYQYALSFVNAGIVDGLDEYGSFGPRNPVSRYELADIFNRITVKAHRVKKDYIEYRSDEPLYLIDDFLMGDTSSVRSIYSIGSGWKYDYTGSIQKAHTAVQSVEDARNAYTNTLRDLSDKDNITISREIFPQRDGELVLETSFHITFGFSGLKLILEDIDGKNIFEMGTRKQGSSDYLYFGQNSTRYASSSVKTALLADPNRPSDNTDSQYRLSDQIRMRMHINLDEGTVKIFISGTQYAYSGSSYTYKLNEGYNGLKKIKFSTGIEDKIEYTVKQVHLYKNYRVNDKFTTHKVNVKPYDYTTRGDVYVEEIYTDSNNQGDFYSTRMDVYDGEDTYAYKSFKGIGGKVKIETFLLTPTGDDGVYFKAGYGNHDVIKVITHNHKFYTADKDGNPDRELRSFTPNTWQRITIEADTLSQTALIKINGKVVTQDAPFLVKTDKFNFIEIGVRNPEKDADFTVWFDDVEVHELFDYPDDYVPEPVPLDTGDYILSMSVCNLWRNGSHYGWAYIEPHKDIEPITGYYDEGNAEAMDWEIKFLAEHGVSTYAMCWYAPTSPATAPIKKPRMSDAHHDGYFNARYSEYLDFSIMWENASYGTPGTSDEFKENIFPFWMDWYFSDPRYFRIQEDGKEYLFLTIYQWANFRNMCLPAGDSTSSSGSAADILRFNQAEIDAASLIKWMEEQVIAAGYADGIILCFTNNGSADSGNISMLNMSGSDTAIFPYAWGNTAYDIDNQKQLVESNYKNAQEAINSLVTEQTGSIKGSEKGLDLLALAAVGFNDVGWAYRRYPLICDEDFEELLEWFRDDYMPRYKDDEDEWKQYFIQFDTWNEFGEGHYIYPTKGLEPIPGTDYKGFGGYGYLEAIAKVFGQNYDEELHEELDIIPTEKQKARLGHLYVSGNGTFIRRQYLPDDMMETPVPDEVTLSFKFNNANSGSYASDYGGFQILSNGRKYIYNTTEKALQLLTAPASANQTNADPIIYFDETTKVYGVNTEDCSILHIRMKSSLGGSPAQMFFRVDTMPKNWNDDLGVYEVMGYSEDYQYTFIMGEPNVWHDYYIDLSSHVGFTGNIVSLRFDTGNFENNTIYISDIEFLKFSDEQKRTAITVDSVPYYTKDYWEIQQQDRNEIYIVPTDENFLYRMLHITYDWNPITGVLFLDTPSGATFEFRVGSDKVLVNGKEELLAKTFYLYDGAPVIPLLYILSTADFNYVHDFVNKTLDITVADKIIYVDIDNANAEDEEKTDVFYSQTESTVSIAEDAAYTFNNIWSVTGNDNLDSSIYTDIEYQKEIEYHLSFDVKLDSFANTNTKVSRVELFLNNVYGDENSDSADHIRSLGYIQYNKWIHIETTFTLSDGYKVDDAVKEMIGFYIKPQNFFESALRGANFSIDNMVIRRLPDLFDFKNGDAEDEDMRMWFSDNATINRIDDGTGNHVIEVIPVKGAGWTYLRQRTIFEAGVTYYFSFDLKMGKNANGGISKVSFAFNSRYDDLLQDHFTQNPNDHSVTFRDPLVSEEDGWRHYSGSFTVSAGRTDNGFSSRKDEDGVTRWYDEVAFYVNPPSINGVNSAMTFYVDNVKFSTTPID